ncbi:complement C1q-like protein 4 isoform X2 [Chanodichthys erythropterus]|uniref:complement C1q-like protein 4 isoform X2 n=1 Tax=Chanodichthys erythropterus TaxID=933992 RepID=UPI00351F7278
MDSKVKQQHQQVDGGLNENEISQQISSEDGRQNPPQTDTLRAEASTIQHCHLCFHDIHAALRELTATVTEQKGNIRALETRLRDAEKAAEQHTFLLEEMNKKNEVTDREIAFSAGLVESGNVDIGPSTTNITLTYRNVFTNIGNAYNPITGIFTAPLKGAYMFKISVYAHGGHSHPANATIMKNEQRVLVAHAQQAQGTLNSSKGVVLILEVGDVVYVRLWSSSKIQDNSDNNHNTFSGFLLFPLK